MHYQRLVALLITQSIHVGQFKCLLVYLLFLPLHGNLGKISSSFTMLTISSSPTSGLRPDRSTRSAPSAPILSPWFHGVNHHSLHISDYTRPWRCDALKGKLFQEWWKGLAQITGVPLLLNIFYIHRGTLLLTRMRCCVPSSVSPVLVHCIV